MGTAAVRQSKIENPKSKIVIASIEDADRALQRIGALQRNIISKEQDASEEIDEIRAALVRDTAHESEVLAANEAALKEWAKTASKEWKGKSLELNFGTVGFRKPTPAIKLKLAIETIVERLRARKMASCIRTLEEPDKEALAAYADDVLLEVGCERTKPKDRFWYECKSEVVK